MESSECDPAAVKCIPSRVGHLRPSAAGSHSNLEIMESVECDLLQKMYSNNYYVKEFKPLLSSHSYYLTFFFFFGEVYDCEIIFDFKGNVNFY